MREPLIEIKGFYKTYGKKIVHDGVNLKIYPGEILTLMGGSGSGKSVLLRSLIGLERPDRGEIWFEGKDITTLSEDDLVEVRKKIAYVFQNGALFDSMTVEENLAYPLREHTKLNDTQIHDKVVETLAKLGLKGSEDLLPADLSGGMQKRVGVARSIIMEPQVILYDEPTSGLDPFNTRQILRVVQQLQSQGATSVLISHDMHSLFEVTDRAAYLKDGKIKAIGTAKEMLNSSDSTVRAFIQGDAF